MTKTSFYKSIDDMYQNRTGLALDGVSLSVIVIDDNENKKAQFAFGTDKTLCEMLVGMSVKAYEQSDQNQTPEEYAEAIKDKIIEELRYQI